MLRLAPRFFSGDFMNPTKQIGRYMLPLLNVVAISQRTGWRAWLTPGYDILLTNGHKIHFTEEEKKAYDTALEEHELVMQVWGMCKSAGLRA